MRRDNDGWGLVGVLLTVSGILAVLEILGILIRR
jgi:hypothetical protein